MFDHIRDNFRDDTNIIHLSLMEAFSNSNMPMLSLSGLTFVKIIDMLMLSLSSFS